MGTERVRHGQKKSGREIREEARQMLIEYNAKQVDWYGRCPLCGAAFVGTLAAAQNHVCDVRDG